MDLYAHSQIKDLKNILEENHIKISRLRGLRLMKNEKSIDINASLTNSERKQFKIWNKYVGKNVLYVHARQGGGNRKGYPIDTTHPMYLEDVDDGFDSTYCDIYYDLEKGVQK